MEDKYRDFIKVAKILNNKDIIPVLYGSLGLYQIIEPLGKIDDIDMLVPSIWLKERWPEFMKYLESHNFHMDDQHEHEFSRSDISGAVAFGSIEESKTHSGLIEEELISKEHDGARYLVLSAEQYLNAYKRCLTDSYRQGKKGDADTKKITALEVYIRGIYNG